MTIRASTARTIVLAMQLGLNLDQAVKMAVDDLKSLKGGFLGGVVIHALDANENYKVVNVNCDEDIKYWYWDDKMLKAEKTHS